MNGAQSFSAAIKESIKAMAQWSVYYFAKVAKDGTPFQKPFSYTI